MRLKAWLAIAASLTVASLAHAAHAEDRAPDAPGAPTAPAVMVKASAGATTRALFDVLVVGAEADVAVGVDTSLGSYGLYAGLLAGAVDGSLAFGHAVIGLDLAWAIGAVRVGVRPRLGYLGIERVTSERQFGAYTLGLAGRLSFAVYGTPSLTVSLGVEPTADVAAALGNDGASADSAAPMLGGRGFLELTAFPTRR